MIGSAGVADAGSRCVVVDGETIVEVGGGDNQPVCEVRPIGSGEPTGTAIANGTGTALASTGGTATANGNGNAKARGTATANGDCNVTAGGFDDAVCNCNTPALP